MISDRIKAGAERAPHRSLLKATGLTDAQIARPLVGIVNSFNEVVPGHAHLNLIGPRRQGRRAGRRAAPRWNSTPSRVRRQSRWPTRA